MNSISTATEVNQLRKKILVFVLFGVIVTGLVTSLSSNLPFYRATSKNLEQITLASLERQVALLNNLLSGYQNLAQQFTSRTEIRQRLEDYNQGELSQAELAEFSRSRLIDAMRLSNDLLGMYRLGSQQEELIQLGLTPELAELRSWLARVDAQKSQPSYYFVSLNNQPVVAVVANILDQQQKLLGQDILFFDSKKLQQSLANRLNTKSDAQAFLVNLDSAEKISLERNQLEITRQLDDTSLAKLRQLQKQDKTFYRLKQEDSLEIAFFLPLEFDKWNLVIQQQAQSFYAPVKQQFILPFLVLILMVSLVGYLLSRLLQPLTYRLAYQAKELKVSTAELRLVASVFEGTREAIAVTDAEMRLVKVNSAFSQITGFKLAEIEGKDLFTLFFQGKSVEKLINDIQASLVEQASWQGEIWYLNKQAKLLPVLQSISAQLDSNNQVSHYIHIFNDISANKDAENKINYLAYYDQLTDLPNRALLYRRLDKAVATSEAESTSLAVLFMDLDNFKEVNDSFGHATGDLLLKNVSERLTSVLRVEDTLGRLGGDEFLLILSSPTSHEDAGKIAEKIIATLTEPFNLDGKVARIGVSIGIAFYPEEANNPSDLVKYADRAMYLAKEKGRNTYSYYT